MAQRNALVLNTGLPEEVQAADTLKPANLPAMVGDSGAGGTQGAVTAPAAGDAAANKFLKADGTWSALTQGFVRLVNDEAGTVVIGAPVYSDAAGGVKKARSNAIGTTKVIGLIADTSILTTATGNVLTEGVLTATTGQWDAITGASGGLTFNTIYFLDPATAGLLTTTAPSTSGQFIVQVGIALSTTQMAVQIKVPIKLGA